MLRNRHVITALLVTPLLAILAWFAVGNLVAEKPQPAQPGEAYPLLEKSNCRYASGQCDLENNDLRLSITLDRSVGVALELEASHALESVIMSVASPTLDPGPQPLRPLDEQGLRWQLPLARLPVAEERIRLVASRSGSAYFGEASTRFLQSEE